MPSNGFKIYIYINIALLIWLASSLSCSTGALVVAGGLRHAG